MRGQHLGVLTASRDQVVDAEHFMAVGEQPLAQMRPDETCSPRYDDAHGRLPGDALATTEHWVHQRPTPSYVNPIWRSECGSSRLRASTITGVAITRWSRVKSTHRNSFQSVRSNTASAPSAASIGPAARSIPAATKIFSPTTGS